MLACPLRTPTFQGNVIAQKKYSTAKGIESRDSKIYLHTHVPSNIIYSSQKVAINRLQERQNVLDTYSEILFRLNKEGNLNTHYNTDRP